MRDDPGFSALERLLGRLMLAGVTLSATCLLLGLLLFLSAPEARYATAVVTIGLITLMVTPALRVLVAVVESVRMRDWFFVATTLAVVLLLGLTLVWSLTHGR